jgi:hypothetical protein
MHIGLLLFGWITRSRAGHLVMGTQGASTNANREGPGQELLHVHAQLPRRVNQLNTVAAPGSAEFESFLAMAADPVRQDDGGLERELFGHHGRLGEPVVDFFGLRRPTTRAFPGLARGSADHHLHDG